MVNRGNIQINRKITTQKFALDMKRTKTLRHIVMEEVLTMREFAAEIPIIASRRNITELQAEVMRK